jgi:uncharacterized protein (TIGR00266 family)
MKYSITGDNLQFVTMEIENGETVWAEAGAMVYMSANMDMKAELQGGLFKGIKRKLAGESFMITNFTSQGGPGVVAFGGNAPGKIYAMDITGKDFLAQKDAFLCAEKSVNWEIAFQKKLGSTFFGGEGLILEKISGSGMVFFHACGDLVEMDLKPGQTYKIATAHVVGWESSVTYDIQAAGGIKTSMFGGEGFFLTTLTGPGKIVIQSMTLPQLADSLVPFLPHSSNSSGGGGLEFNI